MSSLVHQEPDVRGEETTGETYVPYVPAHETIPEFTLTVLVLGLCQAVFFGLADGYLGLKIGMTVSASIPAAVISMAILRGILKRGTILENNLVQNMASVGESLAAGAVFTLPALFLLQDFLQDTGQPPLFTPSWFKAFFVACLGGLMGILFMIPLRRYLIVKEHGRLRYPEGTACAEVLIAGDEGGSQARTVFAAVGVAGLYKFLMEGMKLWNYEVVFPIRAMGTMLSFEMLPSLMAVGFILGLRTCGILMAGALMGWFVIIPVIHYIGSFTHEVVAPATRLIAEMSPGEIHRAYLRYIGAGAVAMGGLVSLIKAVPTILESFREGLRELTGGGPNPDQAIRTFRDIPLSAVLLGCVAIFVTLGLSRFANPAGFLGGFLAVLFAFFFVTVSSRIVGIVGSTSMPLSGMTIGALLVTCLVLKAAGWTGSAGVAAALVIACLVCIAISMGGDISQDLKIGFLVGATPKWVQITQMIAVVISALTVAAVVVAFSPGVVKGDFAAPQANLMFILTRGMMSEEGLPWILLVIGMCFSLTVECMGIASLPFAIGLYLPLSLSTTIIFGGLIHWGIMRRLPARAHKAANDKGLLAASGLVAGDALVGVGLGMALLIPSLRPGTEWLNPATWLWGAETSPGSGEFAHPPWWAAHPDLSNWVTIGLFALLCLYLWRVVYEHGKQVAREPGHPATRTDP
ncbi:MAG TPA: oligopeptide transporter, OPT family [Candidatus Nitrosotenuis sp.]|nr:oligopeptide transporter, OPT family [Candidatus Nitrosotenuis sp.]